MDELQYLEPGEDDRTRGEYFSENGFGSSHFSEGDWGDVQNEQYAREQSANAEMFDGFGQIVTRNRDAEAKMYGDRAVAGAAMIDNASKNPNGMSDRFLSQSLTNAFGQPILGAQILRGLQGDDAKYNGYVAIKGLVKDANGNETVGDVALMSPVAQLKMFQQAKIGDRAMEYRQQLYDGLAKQYTRDQLIAGGIQNPSGAYVVGSHSVPTLTRRRSSISAFGANGNGGFTNYYSGDDTGYQLAQQDSGNRAAGTNGRWKVLRNSPDGVVYENDKTGETRTVKQGQNPDMYESDAVKVARANNEGRQRMADASNQATMNAAMIRAGGRSASGNGGTANTRTFFDKNLLTNLNTMLNAVSAKYTGVDGEELTREQTPEMKKQEESLLKIRDLVTSAEIKRLSDSLGIGGQQEPQPAQRPTTKGMSIIGDTLRYQDDTGNVVNVKRGGKVNIGGQDWYWDGGDGFLTAQEQAKKVLADRAANGGGATTPKTAPVTAAPSAAPSATPAAADKQPKVISPVTAGATASPSAPATAAKTSGKTESQKMREKNAERSRVSSMRDADPRVAAAIDNANELRKGISSPMGNTIDVTEVISKGLEGRERANSLASERVDRTMRDPYGEAKRVKDSEREAARQRMDEEEIDEMISDVQKETDILAKEDERSKYVAKRVKSGRDGRTIRNSVAQALERDGFDPYDIKRIYEALASGDAVRIGREMSANADVADIIRKAIGVADERVATDADREESNRRVDSLLRNSEKTRTSKRASR